MAVKKEVEKIEPLTEGALKRAILDLQELNGEYADLDKRWDALAAKIFATMPPKDTRQYDDLRCTIVQQLRRTVDWKKECYRLAHTLYPTLPAFREFLIYLVRHYKKKAIKASIKLSIVKDEE